MSESKPREFWIEFGGDPSDDKEVYKRYSAAAPFEPSGFSDEVIHVIEYSAYEAQLTLKNKFKDAMRESDELLERYGDMLKRERLRNEKLVEALRNALGHSNCYCAGCKMLSEEHWRPVAENKESQ